MNLRRGSRRVGAIGLLVFGLGASVPITAHELVERGWGLLHEDPQGALALFEQAIDRDRTSAEAHYGRGYALLQIDDGSRQTEATEALCRALELGDNTLRREVGGVLTAAKLACPLATTSTGTVQIRSNRRVLVYIDDRPIGYTPQDVEATVGVHRISAVIPGQPSSRQTVNAEVAADSPVTVALTF